MMFHTHSLVVARPQPKPHVHAFVCRPSQLYPAINAQKNITLATQVVGADQPQSLTVSTADSAALVHLLTLECAADHRSSSAFSMPETC